MIRTLSKQLKEDMCVLQDNLENRWGRKLGQLKTGTQLDLKKSHTEFTLKPKQNSKLNKPVNESQQTVQSQETK